MWCSVWKGGLYRQRTQDETPTPKSLDLGLSVP